MMKIETLLKRINKHKDIIAKQRDQIREIYSELEMLLESFDEGLYGLEEGTDMIERAIDALSEHV